VHQGLLLKTHSTMPGPPQRVVAPGARQVRGCLLPGELRTEQTQPRAHRRSSRRMRLRGVALEKFDLLLSFSVPPLQPAYAGCSDTSPGLGTDVHSHPHTLSIMCRQ
jgi:hypothetical protein